MVEYDTQSIDSSVEIQYPSGDETVLSEIRQLSELDVTKTFDKALITRQILGYVNGLFDHDGDNEPSQNDPLTIYKEVKKGSKFRCVEYAILADSLLWAHGIPARRIGLKTSDIETREYGGGHVVVEFWDNHLKSWVMCDSQWGVIPLIDKVPVSVGALAMAKADDNVSLEVLNAPAFNRHFKSDKEYLDNWLSEYLYYIDTPTKHDFKPWDGSIAITMLVPSGAHRPLIFQNSFKMNVQHTTSFTSFYTPPLVTS